MTKMIDERAVSEVIGVVLLISVTVLGVAIVAVTFFSQPAPSEIPHVRVMAGGNNTTFVLSHEGGDALAEGSYRIYVDNGSGQLVDRTDEFVLAGDGGVWSIDKHLTYTGNGTPGRVVISVVDSGGGETMIDEPAYVASVMDAGGYVDEGGAGSGPKPDPGSGPEPEPEPSSFMEYIIDENVFVYGSTLQFNGSKTYGPGATVIIMQRMGYIDGGASIAVSNIYIDGDVDIYEAGGATLGSETDPGSIYIDGDLTIGEGGRNVYGDVYVNGDCNLTGATMHGDVYVDGNLTLGWGFNLADDAQINYTGTIKTPDDYATSNEAILARCNHKTAVPGFTMPNLEIPSTKQPDSWYTDRGYVPDGTLMDNTKIFAGSYSSTSGNSANNVTIIASDGDISIRGGGSTVTGIFFAPKGNVTFYGRSLEGVVIARDGFFVTDGGTTVTFRNVKEYISNPEDYPF